VKRIFIGGLGRSGTTITLNALYNHHQVLAFPVETKFLVEEDGFAALITALTTEFSVAGSASAIERFENLMRNLVTGLADSKFTQQHELPISLFNHYGEAVDEFMPLVMTKYFFESPAPLLAATRTFVNTTFDNAARAHGYDIWAEKTPSNIWRIDFLRSLWPDCHIVHCVRDPRDILLSFIQREWLPSNMLNALTIFESIVTALLMVRRRHKAEPNWTELRLEELVADTPATMDCLARSVGIEPFHDNAKTAVERSMEIYYAEKSLPAVHLTQEDRELIVSWLRPAVMELGYPEKWSTAQ
jgi:hypothetical protein